MRVTMVSLHMLKQCIPVSYHGEFAHAQELYAGYHGEFAHAQAVYTRCSFPFVQFPESEVCLVYVELFLSVCPIS